MANNNNKGFIIGATVGAVAVSTSIFIGYAAYLYNMQNHKRGPKGPRPNQNPTCDNVSVSSFEEICNLINSGEVTVVAETKVDFDVTNKDELLKQVAIVKSYTDSVNVEFTEYQIGFMLRVLNGDYLNADEWEEFQLHFGNIKVEDVNCNCSLFVNDGTQLTIAADMVTKVMSAQSRPVIQQANGGNPESDFEGIPYEIFVSGKNNDAAVKKYSDLYTKYFEEFSKNPKSKETQTAFYDLFSALMDLQDDIDLGNIDSDNLSIGTQIILNKIMGHAATLALTNNPKASITKYSKYHNGDVEMPVTSLNNGRLEHLYKLLTGTRNNAKCKE